MSSLSTLQPQTPIDSPRLDRRYAWWAAALAPLLLSPIWFALPVETHFGAPSLTGLILTLLLVSATITDLANRKIYNWTTYSMFAWAIAITLAPWVGLNTSTPGLSGCLAGAGGCFLVMLIPYSLARGGAGDVKLATAIGALVGLDAGLLVIGFTYIFAALSIVGWTLVTAGPFTLIAALSRKLTASWLPHVSPPDKQQSVLLEQPIPLGGFFLLATMAVTLDLPTWLRSL